LWTGTAETITFCLSGAGTGMQYGSGSGSGSGSVSGFGSGSNIKCKKVTKYKNERPTFWEIMLLLTLKRQNFVQIILLLENCA
jgi:hypothetical protein